MSDGWLLWSRDRPGRPRSGTEEGACEDHHDLPEAAGEFQRNARALEHAGHGDILVHPFDVAARVLQLDRADDTVHGSERISGAERIAAAFAGHDQVEAVLLLMSGADGGFHQRHVAFQFEVLVAAADGERCLPGLVDVGVDQVTGPGAGLRGPLTDVWHREVVEANRVDPLVEFLGLGAGCLFRQLLHQPVAECDGRCRGLLRHHRQAALERAVLRGGGADAEVVCLQGGRIGVAVFLAVDGEAASVVEALKGLARVVRVLDEPASRDCTRFVDPADAEAARGAGRADHLQGGGARVVVDTAVEGVLLGRVEQGGLNDGHLDVDVGRRLRESEAGHHDGQHGQGRSQKLFHANLLREVEGGF